MSKTKTTSKSDAKEKSAASSGVVPIGSKLSFGASEAYKLLRANLLFSASGDNRCHIIGVTSSVRGEGKSTTSMNISYTFAEAGKRVLLIDGDMRLPQVAKILGLSKAPGLSNYLAGMTDKAPIQQSQLHENLYAITSGDIPPNPSELLSASSTTMALKKLCDMFDYIFIDLPPVNIVSDALVLSNICDGYLVVVRQDYTSRRELGDCVDQLNYVNAKMLGFVMTHSTMGEKGNYKGRKYYKRYGKYNYRYGYNRYGYKHDRRNYEDGYGYGYATKHSPDKDARQDSADNQ